MDNSFMEPFYKQRYEELVREGLREQESNRLHPRKYLPNRHKRIVFLVATLITLAYFWLF